MKRAMLKIRVWQAVFAALAIVGIVLAAQEDTQPIGVGLIVVSLLLLFGLVAVVGWHKQGARSPQ